jgi:2-polyprenyl-3-methyl-5-hydroxy-6-metoxy-1,4-benzoquinol methylase
MMQSRSNQQELIDIGPSCYSQEEYEGCLHQLSKIGRYLGAEKVTLAAFRKIENPQSMLDVGCGGGHFTLQLAEQFPEAQVTGMDISVPAIELAQKELGKHSIKNVAFEVPSSPSLGTPPNSFDIVTATLVCHHLDDNTLVDFLKRSYRVAKKSIIINDLHRHWMAYIGFALIAKPFFSNRLIFHDGLLSVRRSFKKKEWIEYLKAAKIPLEQCSITWHWPFRWLVQINTSSKQK